MWRPRGPLVHDGRRLLTTPAPPLSSLLKLSATATLSSTYRTQNYFGSDCVDGDLDNFCHSSTTPPDTDPSLTLDFGTAIQIAYVAVYNRRDCCQDRLADYTVSYRVRSSDAWAVCAEATAAADAIGPLLSECPHLAQYTSGCSCRALGGFSILRRWKSTRSRRPRPRRLALGVARHSALRWASTLPRTSRQETARASRVSSWSTQRRMSPPASCRTRCSWKAAGSTSRPPRRNASPFRRSQMKRWLV